MYVTNGCGFRNKKEGGSYIPSDFALKGGPHPSKENFYQGEKKEDRACRVTVLGGF